MKNDEQQARARRHFEASEAIDERQRPLHESRAHVERVEAAAGLAAGHAVEHGGRGACPSCLRVTVDRGDLGVRTASYSLAYTISGTHLLETLRRVDAGESADLVYAELWANAEHEQVEDADA